MKKEQPDRPRSAGRRHARRGTAVRASSVRVALRERVKELTCLYGIAQAVARPGLELHEVLKDIVALIPPAWQYPEDTVARITVDGRSHATGRIAPAWQHLWAEIVAGGRRRGSVEVAYSRRHRTLDEGPFLREERSLIDAIAQQVALVIERRQAQDEKARFESQLLHAERLATIGQLAAGVAHELNEPLGSILGFAQLARKHGELPAAAASDLDRIVASAMHAREVIRQLMTFARQTPPSVGPVNLNDVVVDALRFFESRSARAGVELVRHLAPDIPELTADRGQLTQVLTNLVVNALQAMPEGGRLTVETRPGTDGVRLVVEDTGVGMTPEVRQKIFLPFFTTKDISQGTGLGLAVVHGIVTGHGGSIMVTSEPDRGARFEVCLPVSSGGRESI